MNTPSSIKPIGVMLVVVIALATGCSNQTTAPTAGPLIPTVTPQPEIVATVNGQPITKDQFERELARWNAGRVSLGMGEADAKAKQQVLDLLVEHELYRQTAANQGISVSDDDVTETINQMIQDTGQDAFNAWLTSNYYSPEEFREVIRLQLIARKLTGPIVNAVPQTADHIHARHILVNSEVEASEVAAKLQAGEDFAALAAQYSVDVTSKNNGGDLGWFPRGGLLVPEIEDAAFSLQPGQTSGVIATACCGYDIVQTLEIEQRAIDPETRQRLMKKAVDDWSKGLRDGADIQQLITFTQ